jgi:hypothetical protein
MIADPFLVLMAIWLIGWVGYRLGRLTSDVKRISQEQDAAVRTVVNNVGGDRR